MFCTKMSAVSFSAGHASEAQSPGVFIIECGNSNHSPASQKYFYFCCYPRVSRVGLTITGIAWVWRHRMVSETNASHALAHPVLTHTLVRTSPVTLPPDHHTPCDMAEVWSHSLAMNDTATTPPRYRTPVMWRRLFALDSN